MNVGKQTRTVEVFPGLSLVRTAVSLSKQAKLRLKWIDFYLANNTNSRLTCRHFGIAHSTFYRYYNRFKLSGLSGLESRSHRPLNVRQPLTPTPVISIVRSLRRSNPELSKYKLAVILKRDYGYSLSPSSIGRILTRHKLFFEPPVRPKSHPYRRTSIKRLRKPSSLKPSKPGDLIEVDVKHLPYLGPKHYGFVAIDVVSKQACIHVASTISAKQGAVAWDKAVKILGLPRAVLTDNGSENLGAFAALLQSQPVDHYFARPRTPKDKPHVERFIGTLEREFIQWGGVAIDLSDQQNMIDTWLVKYHSYRPHQALGYLTPNEYLDKIKHEEVALII